MGKARRSWNIDTVRVRLESAKKTRRRLRLILPLVGVLVFWGASASFAAMTCGSPDSCVVVFDNYRLKPLMAIKYQLTAITDVSNSCSSLGVAQTTIIMPEFTPLYDHVIAKYYWDGTTWKPIDVREAYTPNADSGGAEYVNDLSKHEWLSPYTLYPNGCSGIPKPIPGNAPNPDPGKPDCNNQVL